MWVCFVYSVLGVCDLLPSGSVALYVLRVTVRSAHRELSLDQREMEMCKGPRGSQQQVSSALPVSNYRVP